MLKLNVSSGYLLHQLLQRRSRIATLHRLCRCRCRLLELLLLLSKRRSLVFASRGLKLLLYEWLLLLCLLLLLWTKTIPQVLMISPTGIISVGLRIILLLLRSEWLSRLHGRNINNLFCFLVWNRHLFNDQKHNIYHITLVDWLPSHSTVDQWLATSQGMSTL